jgi:hypothetical protein
MLLFAYKKGANPWLGFTAITNIHMASALSDFYLKPLYIDFSNCPKSI